MKHSRYIVGIDLGTTTCSLAYLDTLDLEQGIRVLPIPQWDAESAVIKSDILPSFAYMLPKSSYKKQQFNLNFHGKEQAESLVIGSLAQKQASVTPGRVIHAAKSWLCHGGVDRERAILPWHSDEIIGDQRLSPVEVSAAFLRHLRLVWQEAIAGSTSDYFLESQQVIITVPASFDEVASELTLKAAALAGFDPSRVKLIEEPQAAFYYWQYVAGNTKDEKSRFSLSAEHLNHVLPDWSLEEEKIVLVCDVGGGTTDFSLFSAHKTSDQEAIRIKRITVSDHILLGGDNFDLKLAKELEKRLVDNGGSKLSSRQWAKLVFEARALKEKALFMDSVDEELFVSIAKEGASLFASTQTIAIKKSEIIDLLQEGFFPDCEKNEHAALAKAGLREWNLPYAYDTGVTRHLAGFLKSRPVDAVLYTGGTLKPSFFQQRLTAQMTQWQGFAPKVLANDAMDLAVSQGAAIYGAALRYSTGYIEGGYPRSLYMEVDVLEQAKGRRNTVKVCILPKGYTGEESLDLSSLDLKLLTGKPVSFKLFYSNEEQSKLGDVITSAGSLQALAPMQTKLEIPGKGKKNKEQLLAVDLEMSLTETGLLAIYCVAKELDQRWHLKFNVQDKIFNEQSLKQDEAKEIGAKPKLSLETAVLEHIDEIYGKRKQRPQIEPNPNRLLRDLEKLLGEKQSWELNILRSLWEPLKDGETRRGRSEHHETVWLNLVGYCLRPGYGEELDSFRISDLWSVYEKGMVYPSSNKVKIQWWILWRRVAGGLNKNQQEKIFDKIFPSLKRQEASPDVIMLLGSLERVDANKKIRLGQLLVDSLNERKTSYAEQKIWALARIASRQPLYGGSQVILRPSIVRAWIEALKHLDCSKKPYRNLAHFYSQSARIVDDREFDLDEGIRLELAELLSKLPGTEEQIKMLKQFVAVDQASRDILFGEHLPLGLVLS